MENSSGILENGLDNVADRVEFQYNRAGEVVWKTNQDGTFHTYRYDNLGRMLLASGIRLGADKDSSSIAIEYDHLGNVKRISSRSFSTLVVNQIMYEYDDHGLLHKEYSNPNGTVNVNTSSCITYTYDKSKDENDLFVKSLRPISVTYPSGRIISYEYGTEDSESDRLNRYTAIKDGAVTLVTYVDEGVSTTAKVTYPQPGLSLDYTASGALDRFGRVTDHAWKKSATNIARIKHGYDRAGNRLHREDTVGAGFSELYGYDGVNQLTDMQRGTLNGTKTSVTNKNFAENFAFDATGNWQSFHRDTEGNGTWELYQTREHNKANEIVSLGGTNTYVASDKNGNMTRMPKPDDWSAAYDCVYDAWNRLTQVKDGNAVLATYVYNGLNQRIRKTVGSIVTESVFNRNWQELESKINGVTTTYVWGLRYIDDLVCRDKGSERIYAIQDPNWNVVAVTDIAGVVKERITYDAFGKPAFLDASYGHKTTSGYAWNRTFTGQVYDSETGLILYRNRAYHPGLGRFMTRDPIGYMGQSLNLFSYVSNKPNRFVDHFGLQQDWGFLPPSPPRFWYWPQLPQFDGELPEIPTLPPIDPDSAFRPRPPLYGLEDELRRQFPGLFPDGESPRPGLLDGLEYVPPQLPQWLEDDLRRLLSPADCPQPKNIIDISGLLPDGPFGDILRQQKWARETDRFLVEKTLGYLEKRFAGPYGFTPPGGIIDPGIFDGFIWLRLWQDEALRLDAGFHRDMLPWEKGNDFGIGGRIHRVFPKPKKRPRAR